jgi:hypothetical protein
MGRSNSGVKLLNLDTDDKVAAAVVILAFPCCLYWSLLGLSKTARTLYVSD